MIKAEIVAHSLSPQGDELISVLCTFPRIILAEVNTHRMLSKNTSSSRAIPFEKMLKAIEENPFIPIAWQKDHKGMQGTEYHTEEDSEYSISTWLDARDRAVQQAILLNSYGTTKQLCNRLLESFMWTTMLITGSREGWDNFFNLRCNSYILEEYDDYEKLINQKTFKSKKEILKNEANWYIKDFEKFPKDMSDLDWLKLGKGQAEIHMMALAECIWDAVNESTPKQLNAGEWHIPFGNMLINRIEEDGVHTDSKIDLAGNWIGLFPDIDNLDEIPEEKQYDNWLIMQKVKIAIAMCARTSYTVIGDEKEVSYKKMLELHDKLIIQNPRHSSPMEHCARAMSDEEYNSFIKGSFDINYADMISDDYKTIDGVSNLSSFGWCYNLKGFISYRYMVDNKIY